MALTKISSTSNAESKHLGYAISSLWAHRALILRLIKRDIQTRYRGSILGLGWALLTPLFMLGAYTFTFQTVFGARWGKPGENVTDFAVVLFLGMIIYNIFAECLTRAPALILSQPNYVTKIVFPLHVLPAVVVGSAFFQGLVSLLVWLFFALTLGQVSWHTALFWPLLLMPFAICLVALVWLLSSLGVYLRDLNHSVGLVATAMMFLSPLFFPVSALPDKWRWVLTLNPLTYFIEQTRSTLLWGGSLDWFDWGLWMLFASAFAGISFWWFQTTRKGFADVL